MNSRNLLALVAVACAFLQAAVACAETVDVVDLSISSSGLVVVNQEFTISSNDKKFNMLLPPDRKLNISSSGVPVHYENKSLDDMTMISLNPANLLAGSNAKSLSLDYETQYITSKNGSVWSISFSTKTTPRKTIVKVHLPKNSTIISLLPRDVLFSIVQDSLWLYPQGDEFNFTCNYEHVGNLQIPIVDNGSNSTYIMALAAIVITCLALLAYYIYRRRSTSKVVGKVELNKDIIGSSESAVEGSDSKKLGEVGGVEFEFKTDKTPLRIKSTVLNVLDDAERGIVAFIQQHGPDDVTQAFIYKTTRMPKSSLSELIKRLEKRNVVECRKEGRVNWIKLKKWVLE